MSNRPNTTGTRGGRAGRRPFPLVEETYNKDNEQQFRRQLDERIAALAQDTETPDGSITTDKLADEAVTTAKIDDLAVTTGKIADDAVTDAKLRESAAVSVIGRSANSTGNPADIAAGANDTLLRRVSNALSFGALTIGMFGASLVTYAKIQQVSATSRFLGRITASAGDIEELTGTQATSLLDNVVGDSGSGGTKGLVPAPASGDAAAKKFLRADATFATPGTLGTYTALSSTATTLTGIPATAKMVVLNIAGMSWDNTAAVRIRIGPSGGVATSGYLGASVFLNNTASVAGNNFTAGLDFASVAATGVYHGQLVFTLADAATNTWVVQGQLGRTDNAGLHTISGSVPLSGVLERISIGTVAGTAAADAGSASHLAY